MNYGSRGRLQSGLQAAEEDREVCALSSVKSVQFIDHDILQRVGGVLLPQSPVLRTDEEVIQHLVVRQQDVRRFTSKRITVRDDLLRRHRHLASARLAAHIQADTEMLQGCRLGNRGGDTSGLVRSQGVHRVYDERLDTALPLSRLTGAVIKYRVKKTLRLTTARPGRDQGALWRAQCGQPIPSILLVDEARILRLKISEEVPPLGPLAERQADLDERTLQPARLIFGKARDQSGEAGIGRLKARHQEVAEASADFAGKEGWEHRDQALDSAAFFRSKNSHATR